MTETLRYVESHAHMDFPDYKNDRAEIIRQVFDSGCMAIVNPGADIMTSHSAIELSSSYERIFAGVGIHPHEATRYLTAHDDVFDLLYRDIENLKKLSEFDKVVAIGECGLDYYRLKIDDPQTSKIISLQKDLFRLQLGVAKERDLPVIMHIRDAHEDVLELLDIEQIAHRGVAHCYDGPWPVTEVLLSKGFYIGFTANITYPKKDDVHEVIRKIPLERILLETDSPYLSPQTRRGQRNDPRSVIDVGKAIAEIKKVPVEDVFRQTTTNAIQLFSLPIL